MHVRTYASMYVCMYACMYVCMYVCLYACIYVCMYIAIVCGIAGTEGLDDDVSAEHNRLNAFAMNDQSTTTNTRDVVVVRNLSKVRFDWWTVLQSRLIPSYFLFFLCLTRIRTFVHTYTCAIDLRWT